MTAPVPSTGTQDLAERVARAHHAANYQAKGGWPSWDDSPSPYRSDMLRSAGQWLDAVRAAGLAVVELPEPDFAGDTAGSRAARWGPVRAVVWADGSEPRVRQSQLPDQFTADEAEALAARFLAAARWLRGQGGDPR